jgi:protein ImuB
MEDSSDHRAQLPLPAMPEPQGATVIPLPTRPPAPRPEPDQGRSPTPRRSLWYALYFPQLEQFSADQQRRLLKVLAEEVNQVSATVSYHPQTLVAEVRSSLKYFGGLKALHQHLQPLLQQRLNALELPGTCHYAAAPTVSGSLLLARAGCNSVVYQRANLRSALGQLPFEVLELGKEPNRRLYNMGVRQLKDLWRLPMDGLRKRFGSALVTQLNKALGKAPEPTHNYLPPPAFETACDLHYGVESLERLLPVADEMLAQLVDFLRRRDLATSRLVFALQHENRAATEVSLGLRQPSRDRGHLLLLLETHFAQLSIPAPVCTLKLAVLQFDAFTTDSGSLLRDKQPGSGNLELFMEQLRARLGVQPVKTLNSVAEHCPEYASRLCDYEAGSDNLRHAPQQAAVASNPRPLWLLPEPLPLTRRGDRLYHRQPVTLLSGPERIETRWWAGRDIRRDYYVARESCGSRLWVFRERDGERGWYLHGFFA